MPKGGKPIGNYAIESSRGMIKQNQTADIFAKAGYKIDMLDEIPNGNGKGITPSANPDFEIEGNVFDCYSPEAATSVDSICRTIASKTKTQAERIILNLDDYLASDVEELTKRIIGKTNETGDLKRLNELFVVRDNVITRIFGR